MFYYLILIIFIKINKISVDYLDPVNFRCNHQGTATLLQRSLKDSDYQAHFTAVLDDHLSLSSLNNH